MNKFLNKDLINILFLIILSFSTFILVHDVCNSSILNDSGWSSYEIQAESWLNGRIDVDYRDYLELAIFEDKCYVSFPPLPSVILLPFVAIWGVENFAGSLIMYIVALLIMIISYNILRKYGTNETVSILISYSLIVGNCIFAISLNSGVWFIAQLFNMFFCMLAVKCLLEEKKALTYFLFALAVGCRPLSAIYIVASFIYFLIKDRKRGFVKSVLGNILPLIPMIMIAICYMGYNYARFKNPIEFGHNYLPEFTRIEEGNFGQFSIKYFWNNIKELFGFRIKINEKLNLNFTWPFMFYLANPFLFVSLLDGIKKLIKNKRISVYRIPFIFAMVLNIIFLCLHKTLGGWQFGARYTCDLLATAFLCLLINNKPIEKENGSETKILSFDEKIQEVELDSIQIMCILFGIVFNIVGAIEFWRNELLL